MSNALSVLCLAAAMSVCAAADAQQFYQFSDGTVTYEKASFADVSEASAWDLISPTVALTRQSTRAIYNPLAESSHIGGVSPSGTLWFVGGTVQDVVDGSLELSQFEQWTAAVSSAPQSTIGIDSVLYLIAEDTYLDFRLDVFGGGNSGGALTYTRAAIPAPATAVPLVGGMLYTSRRRRV